MKTPRIYWHGPHCYCDHVRLPEDAPCPVCDASPRPEVRTMPNGGRYIAAENEPLQKTQHFEGGAATMQKPS